MAQKEKNNQALQAKINRLELERDELTPAACAGDLLALKKRSLILMKIEVTKNRINGLFGTTRTAALEPDPRFLQVR